MIRCRRPKQPDSFDADLSDDRAAVRRAFQRRRRGVDDDEKPAIPNRWGKYKASFSEAQHRKCGYCETKAVVGADGDVEHYFPKAAIWQLDDEGQEVDFLGNVSGRNFTSLAVGYWWLAYHWKNYLLSCGNCNRKWKRNFFPVTRRPRSLPPVEGQNEKPLLLNPYERKDPVNHLEFGEDGSVVGLSRVGRETIRICGLDRPSLRDARLQDCRRAGDLLRDLNRALQRGDDAAEIRALHGLHKEGSRSFEYAGVYRSMTKHLGGLSWKTVEQRVAQDLVDQLAAATPDDRVLVIDELIRRIDDFDKPDLVHRRLRDDAGTTLDDLRTEASAN